MPSPLNRASLPLAALLISTALARPAAAQSADDGAYELRPFVGAYIPTGDQRDLLENAATLGAQLAIPLAGNLSVLGTLAWSPSAHKAFRFDDEVDVFQYDIGAEYQQPFAVGTGTTIAPFVGLGLGGRTYDYRDRETGAETDFAGYGAVGGHLRVGTVGFRLEVREYLSRFQGLDGEMPERETRRDVAILSALTLSF